MAFRNPFSSANSAFSLGSVHRSDNTNRNCARIFIKVDKFTEIPFASYRRPLYRARRRPINFLLLLPRGKISQSHLIFVRRRDLLKCARTLAYFPGTSPPRQAPCTARPPPTNIESRSVSASEMFKVGQDTPVGPRPADAFPVGCPVPSRRETAVVGNNARRPTPGRLRRPTMYRACRYSSMICGDLNRRTGATILLG